MGWLLVSLALLAASLGAADNGPALLRLSDLPAVHYTPVLPVTVPRPGTTASPAAQAEACTRFDTCFHCADRDDRCGWCTRPDGTGSCVALEHGNAQCLARGGTLGGMETCPFLTHSLLVTSIVVGLCSLLACSSGIGGGALFVPIYLILYGLTAHQAVPLSKVTIFGISIGGILVLYRQRHPERDQPLVDYDLVALIVPSILLGTVLGVYVNVMLPEFMIVAALVLLLVPSSYRSWQKALQMYHKETAASSRHTLTSEVIDVELDELGPAPGTAALGPRTPVVSDALAPILKREAEVPWKKFGLFLIMFVGLVCFVFLKGSGHGASVIGVTCGSAGFFVVLFAMIPYMGTLEFLVARRVLREMGEKVAAGYKFLAEDLRYTPRLVFTICGLSLAAGCAAGSLGIGAGMVVAPIMLELGVAPSVAQASSSFTVLFTSGSTSVQFILLGKLPWRAAIWFWVIGFVSAIAGQNLLAYLMDRYKKQFLLGFLLAVMISLSFAFMFGLQVHDMVRDGVHFTGFRSPCSTKIG